MISGQSLRRCVSELRSASAVLFIFSSRRRHTRYWRDWSSGVCSSDLVASPEPRSVVDGPAIEALIAAGFVVVCAGGGGIPVTDDGVDGGPHQAGLRGVEAVIDKDLTAAILAREVGADALVIATDVPNVMVDFGTPSARPLGRVTADELRAHAADGQFARGSMGPKVEAALRFVEGGGTRAVITSLEHIADAVERDDVGTVLSAA